MDDRDTESQPLAAFSHTLAVKTKE